MKRLLGFLLLCALLVTATIGAYAETGDGSSDGNTTGPVVKVTGQFFSIFGQTKLKGLETLDCDPVQNAMLGFKGKTLWDIDVTAGPAKTNLFGKGCIAANWAPGVYEVKACDLGDNTIVSKPAAVTVFSCERTGFSAGGALCLGDEAREATFGVQAVLSSKLPYHSGPVSICQAPVSNALLFLDPCNPCGPVKITSKWFTNVCFVDPITVKINGYCTIETGDDCLTGRYFEAFATVLPYGNTFCITVFDFPLKPIYCASGYVKDGGAVVIP